MTRLSRDTVGPDLFGTDDLDAEALRRYGLAALAAALELGGAAAPAGPPDEEAALERFRRLLGLDDAWHGTTADSAATSTLLALLAARERTDLDVRQRGLAGRPDVPLLRIYTSEHPHPSVARAAIALGLGRDAVRTVASDERYRMLPSALADAIREDVRFGYRPMAIVPTVGTAATGSIDPVAAVVEVRDRLQGELGHPVWVHVDGTHAGMLAVCPEHRAVLDGVGGADSFTTNPHAWLFAPHDVAALFLRDATALTGAFGPVPDEPLGTVPTSDDHHDGGGRLGRRVRALELGLLLDHLGADGLAERIRGHLARAGRVARFVEGHPDLELVAPVASSTVCFRAAPSWLVVEPPLGSNDTEPDPDTAIAELLEPDPRTELAVRASAHVAAREERLSELNQRLLARIDAPERGPLAPALLDGRYLLRISTTEVSATDDRLEATLARISRELERLSGETQPG